MLSIGVGYPTAIETDINLIIHIVILLIIFVSLYFKNKGDIKRHGTIMGIAVVLHVASLVVVMAPLFAQSFSFYSSEFGFTFVQTAWLHAVPGIIAILLGIFLVTKWVFQPSDVGPCYARKRLMDVTVILWIFSLIFGIATYILIYF
jgi:uncharacterized membrane protein YozB (DUF420 family)